MKDAVTSAANTLVYVAYDIILHEDKFWESVSSLNGRALALVVAERLDDFSEYDVREHHVDFGKLDASDWIMLLSRRPSIAKYLKYACKDSLWERDDEIANDEIAPGVWWHYRIHAGRLYTSGWDRMMRIADREEYFKRYLDVITVPSHIDGIPVFSIGSYTFNGFYVFSKLVVSDGVVEIGRDAFAGGYGGPREVHLPITLKFIRNRAFEGCHALKELTIPEGCVRIGGAAFGECSSLRRIVIPTTMESIGNRAFRGCEKLEEIVMECEYCKFGQGILEGCRSIKKILGPQRWQLEAANFT